MEWRLSLHLGVVAIEKGANGSPSTYVANFTNFSIRAGCDRMLILEVEFNRFEFRIFKFKEAIFPTFCSKLEGELLESYFTLEYWRQVKCK